MRSALFTTALFGAAFAAPIIEQRASSAQVPFKFPLDNGFPNLNTTALATVEKTAHGSLPGGALPKTIAAETATIFSVIQFAEFIEVALFSSLLNNITNNVPGYTVGSKGLSTKDDRDFIIKALHTIKAQEQLHATGAGAILSTAGHPQVKPCEYIFPFSTYHDAIAFAASLNDLILGTLQEAIRGFADDGDHAFTNLIASVIGTEGEQVGFFRLAQQVGKTPTELPFLTASSAPFAFSAMNQLYVLPGSCPNAPQVPIFGALAVDSTGINCETKSIKYSFAASSAAAAKGLSLSLVNGLNLPVTVPIQNVAYANGRVSFTAQFNGTEGLTIAALTKSAGPFADVAAVAGATVFGPGVIELN